MNVKTLVSSENKFRKLDANMIRILLKHSNNSDLLGINEIINTANDTEN